MIAHETLDVAPTPSRSTRAFWIVFVNLALLAAFAPSADTAAWAPAVATWITIVVAIVFQAVPFLVLGVALSGLIAGVVSPASLARAIPSRPSLAVPVAGLAGAFLPGCECSSVPVAGRLVSQGAPASSVVTFLLAAPAINPVVLVATAVAFPGQPRMVLARFVASLVAAIAVGLVWERVGRDEWLGRARRPIEDRGSRWLNFVATVEHDFLHAGGFLVLGAMTAATLKVAVPSSVLDSIAGHGIASVLGMAVLAVVLAVCSEADAFVAASFTQFSVTAKLVFLVVGPMVDLKLIAMQIGVFGRAFASRFAPLSFGMAVTVAVVTAKVLL